MAKSILAAAPNDFYVYVHRRASDGKIFYVGKGRGRRATFPHGRNRYWKNVVAKHGLTVEYAVKGVSEARAFEVEAELIAHYGRDRLCNLTDGGEGMRGHKKGPETIAKLKAAMAARDLTPELIEKMVGHRRGTKHSERTKALMRKRWDDERRAAHSAHRSATTKSRAIVCIETGQSFSRVNYAVDWLISSGVASAAQGNLVACARGRRKSAYGYTWKYLEP